jgi:hypothetical protein
MAALLMGHSIYDTASYDTGAYQQGMPLFDTTSNFCNLP